MKILKTTSEIFLTSKNIDRMKQSGFNYVFSLAQKEEEIIREVQKHKPTILFQSIQKVTEPLLEAGKPELKAIVFGTSGYDHVDIPACNKHNIMVANAPGRNARAVAEYAMAQLISINRKIFQANQRLKEGVWNRAEFSSTGLENQTIGILGNGNISKRFQEMASVFRLNCKIKTMNSKVDTNPRVTQVDSIDELMDGTIGLFIAASPNPTTKNIINKDVLSKITTKDQFIIINTSRGSFVKQDDILSHLDNNKSHLYVTDVFENEPMEEKSTVIYKTPITQHPQTIISPHMGYMSDAAREAAFELVFDNIKDFKANKVMRNAITKF